VQTADKILA